MREISNVLIGDLCTPIAGPLCEWKHKTTDKWDIFDTFEEYKSTLTLECETTGQPFNLTWTVPMDAPKTLYYQVSLTNYFITAFALLNTSRYEFLKII